MANADCIIRKCTKCKSAKTASEFYKDKRLKDGLCRECKACTRAVSAVRYAMYPEKCKAATASWKEANKEGLRFVRALRYEATQEQQKAASAARYAANPGRANALSAAWHAANPEAKRAYRQNRRAQKLQAGGKLSSGLAEKLFKLQKGLCPCCSRPLGSSYHLDHIMPLALGGENTDGNMQLLRNQCNKQKHAKHPVDFMQSRGFLV